MSYRGGVSNQQQEEQYVMQSMLVKLTMSINSQCFQECVTSYKDEKLDSKEVACIKQCAKRHSEGRRHVLKAFSSMDVTFSRVLAHVRYKGRD